MTAQPATSAYGATVWSVLFRRLAPWFDPVLGVLVTAAALVSLLGADPATLDPRLDPPNALAVVATTVAGLSLVWRRSRPTASYVVFVTGCLVVSLSGHYIGLLSVFLLVPCTPWRPTPPAAPASSGWRPPLAVFVVLALLDVPDLGTGDLLQAVALLLAAWALGDAVRSRRAQQRDELRAAEQEAVAAREQAALAASDERLRIARELHDVVAHSMSLIAVQAGVGAHVIRDDPDAAARALDVIAETSRSALDQTRALVGLLREDGERATRPPTARARRPRGVGRRRRPRGRDRTARAHRDGVRRRRAGGSGCLPGRAGVTDQRPQAHGRGRGLGPRDVVRGRARPRGRGPRPGPPVAGSAGHGLLGLEERVHLLGGRISSGPDGAGFRVAATLPTGRAA